MRFRDIQQFTRRPNYHIDVRLDYLRTQVDNDIDEMGLQLCPDFQRGHVWTTNQQIAYVEYILKGGVSGRDLYFNCPGWHSGEFGDYVCVDGLQRITALLKFVNDELHVFGSLYSEYEDNSRMTNNVIWHVNNLQTKKEVLTWYLEMNTGGTPHSKEELDRVAKMLNNCEQ